MISFKKKKPIKTNKPFRKTIKILWISFASFVILMVLFFTSISNSWIGVGGMPSFEELENPRSNLASEIYSSDQVLLGKFYIENRSNVFYSELSPNLINALIATEDIRFEKHSGVDLRAILRAVKGVVTGNSSGGGSTVTQQLAKNLFPRGEDLSTFQTVIRKFQEWVTAIKLERNYTKNEILAMYFNTVDFGSQSFGIKSASRTFFDSTPDSLKIEEAAVLVGLLKAPTKYSPIINPENSFERRNVVLGQMEKYGFITTEIHDSLVDLPLDMSKYRIQDHNEGIATYFREHLRMLMTADEPDLDDYNDEKKYNIAKEQWDNNPIYGWCNKNTKADGSNYNIYKDGLRIYTTVNSKMQVYAEDAVKEHFGKYLQPIFYKRWKGVRKAPWSYQTTDSAIEQTLLRDMKSSDRYRNGIEQGKSEEELEKEMNTEFNMRVFSWDGDFDTVMTPMDSIMYYKWFLQVGMMSVEPQTGYVRAYVGGINHNYFKLDHVCGTRRQVGSTFKPFVYALAMQEGEFSPCTKVPNVPVTFELENGKEWTPRNSGTYKDGEMVSLKEALAHSINYISAYLIKRYSPQAVIRLARKMGVKSEIPAVPAIALGVSELSVYEMVGEKSTYANKGVYVEPIFVTRIEDKNGNVIQTFVPNKNEAMSEETAYLMLKLMQGVVASGTGGWLHSRYGLRYPIAGKTGTTDDNSDGWFMGITPDLVTGVWVGCDDMRIHFRSTALGQGASMALPIWALYMQKVYADKDLNISKEDFEKPSKPLSIETDCEKYNREHPEEQDVNSWNSENYEDVGFN
jgi:penicillin-binding protein 1A